MAGTAQILYNNKFVWGWGRSSWAEWGGMSPGSQAGPAPPSTACGPETPRQNCGSHWDHRSQWTCGSGIPWGACASFWTWRYSPRTRLRHGRNQTSHKRWTHLGPQSAATSSSATVGRTWHCCWLGTGGRSGTEVGSHAGSRTPAWSRRGPHESLPSVKGRPSPHSAMPRRPLPPASGLWQWVMYALGGWRPPRDPARRGGRSISRALCRYIGHSCEGRSAPWWRYTGKGHQGHGKSRSRHGTMSGCQWAGPGHEPYRGSLRCVSNCRCWWWRLW